MNPPLRHLSVRPRVRRGRFSLLAKFVLSLFVIEAVYFGGAKTNGVSNIPPRMAPVVATVSAEEIARGWRVKGVATNAGVSYAMPAGVEPTFNWHRRGTFGEWRRLDLGDFAFPFGTNDETVSSFSAFSDGRIRPTPRDAGREIRAVGVPMLAMQGTSRFWTSDGANGSRILTWEGFFLGADTNAPVSAQIELRPSGDFVARSNEVETCYVRVNPDDWDGDGLHNERDARPTVSDGDFFGAANALPAGANEGAYYWLDLAATGGLGVATIRVTCDEPSDLGDHVVVARTNQVCHVPLLAGATYFVESDLPIGHASASSEYAQVETNAATSLTVALPLELFFEHVPMRGGSGNYVAHTSPVDVAPRILSVSGGCCPCATNATGFSWVCGANCNCGGYWHDLAATAVWGGYSRLFDVDVSCPCQADKLENPQLWMSLNVPAVVFINATNYVSTLAVLFDPPVPTNGVIRLRCVSGGDKFVLRSEGGSMVTLPRQWNAEMFSGETFTVEGVAVSGSGGDIGFELEYDEPGAGVHRIGQSMTVARVARVSMTSAVAGESANPPPFDGETACPFSVTNSLHPDRHLVVPFCNVVDAGANFSVEDFDVDMAVELAPSNAPMQGVTALWSVLDGTPQSGTLSPGSGLSASFQNPKVGGVYRFSVTCNGSPATEMNLVLPLAGASVDAICENDLVLADEVIRIINATTGSLERQSPFFGVDWFYNNGMGDYLGRVDSSESSTVWRYNTINDDTGMGAVATWFGLSVRMAKASNFMVGYATARLGVWNVSRSISQLLGSGNDAAASMSWNAGVDVAHGTNFAYAVGNFVTNTWSTFHVKEKTLWPNLSGADNHAVRNTWTNFNYQFISPGFIERGRTP